MSFTTNRQPGNKIMQVAKQFAGRPVQVLIFFNTRNLSFVYGTIKEIAIRPTAKIYVDQNGATEMFKVENIHSILGEFEKPQPNYQKLLPKTILLIVAKNGTVFFGRLQQTKVKKCGLVLIIENWYPAQVEDSTEVLVPVSDIKEVYIPL